MVNKRIKGVGPLGRAFLWIKLERDNLLYLLFTLPWICEQTVITIIIIIIML